MSDTLDALHRHELDQLAAEAGVPDPAGLPNKAAVIAAIEKAHAGRPEPSAAFVLEPADETREPVTYIVTGVQPVYATRPGGEFTRLIPKQQEAQLIEGGAIAIKPVDTDGTTNPEE